jgi:hypothetical protein
LAFELDELELPPPLAPAAAGLEEPLLEQAAMPRTATPAAAASPKYGFLRDMDVLLDVM